MIIIYFIYFFGNRITSLWEFVNWNLLNSWLQKVDFFGVNFLEISFGRDAVPNFSLSAASRRAKKRSPIFDAVKRDATRPLRCDATQVKFRPLAAYVGIDDDNTMKFRFGWNHELAWHRSTMTQSHETRDGQLDTVDWPRNVRRQWDFSDQLTGGFELLYFGSTCHQYVTWAQNDNKDNISLSA